MSEEVQKSAEEQLKDIVLGVTAEKAEKAEVAELKSAVEAIEVPSLEGFVKQEALDALVAKMEAMKTENEDLVAAVKSAPAIMKGDKVSEYVKWEGEGINVKTSLDFSEFQKTFTGTGNAQISGSMTMAARVFHELAQMNPFRGVATVMPTSAGAVELPQVTNIDAVAEANSPVTIDATNPGGSTPAHYRGTISNVTVVPQNWVGRESFSDQVIEDLPGLDPMIASFMGQSIARREAADMVAQLDGNTSITEIHTGEAAAMPTTIGPWADLVASLDSAYKMNAKFMLSRGALSSLRSLAQSTGADLVIDPQTGNFKLWGFDMLVNDHLDTGNTANDNAVYFGDFSRGSIIVSRKEMNISRHEDTIPGSVYYYGNMRSRGVAWDTNALVRFSTEA